jgi:hypothetical protein
VSSCQPECHHRRIDLTVVASHRSLLALMLVDQLFDLTIIELKYDFVNGRRKAVAAGRSGNASAAGGRTVPRRTAVPEVTAGSRTDLAGHHSVVSARLAALVRAGATFIKGKLAEHP